MHSNSQDLKGRLSTRDELLFQADNIGIVGVNILAPKTSNLAENEEKKAKVLNELSPTWKIPGAALESITDRMKELAVPGARIAVFDKAKGDLWSAGFGKLEDPNLKIQSASISKTITALTILSLIEDKIVIPKTQKSLTLETDIKDVLDEDLWDSISNGQKEPITIRQLMAHTAGLEGESHMGFRGYYRDKNSEIGETNDQIARLKDELQNGPNTKIEQQIVNLELALTRAEERAENQQLPTIDEIIKGKGTNSSPAQNVTQPGTEFSYAGGGAMILQKIIETVSDEKDFGKIVDARVFNKLEMKHSTFSPDEHEATEGYRQTGDPLPGGWMQQPELAAAGLWSTPEDLAKVLIGIQSSLSNGSFLSQASAKEMVTPYFENEVIRLNEELKNLNVNLDGERINGIKERLNKLQEKKIQENEAPGLGVFIEKTRDATYFYHSGSNLGFRCLMIANDQGQGAVVMTNSETGIDLIPEVIRKIAEVYKWKGSDSFSSYLIPRLHPEVVEANRTNEKIDAEKWKEHKGIYASDSNSENKVVIEEVNGKFRFKTPGPTFDVKPVTKNIGIFQEQDGRWFPLEFKNNVLTIHGRTHTKLDETTGKTGS